MTVTSGMFRRASSCYALCRLSSKLVGAGMVPLSGQTACGAGAVRQLCPPASLSLFDWPRCYGTGPAGNTRAPHHWASLEPELEETLVPRKLALSPLESWLSLRYSLPQLTEVSPLPMEDQSLQVECVLPSVSSAVPLSCKNVLEIRRRKMNRHKYKKLLKRTRFRIRRVRLGRSRRKQKRFERDLRRILKGAGLKRHPKGWRTPKIFIRRFGQDRNQRRS